MRNATQTLLTLLALTGVITACKQTDINGTNDLYIANDQAILNYASQKAYKGSKLTSGLYFYKTDSVIGAKKPAVGEEVQFNYKSYNINTGVLVDSSASTTPVYYPYGIQSILSGLEQGLGLMGEGDKAIMLLPSYIGYNDRALTNLPAYSPVRFDVTLVRSRTQDQQISDYISRNSLPTPELSTTGLRFIRTQTNTAGTSPTTGQTVTIRYAGRTLRSRTAFDSTGTGTFDATLGQGKYVAGFEEGLSKLRVGEKATIIFPSTLGYGTTGVVQNNTYIITPYAPLRFDLEVVSVK
ncbi:FKBP-type peptidyl-prolyl cis-trans isomerase [Spirosoma rhododendri]|uniref:Peptidyl-prolyl cis-trans isomerase n=1 Tax=Spirosoma rhododendri TaxID=2728024 RepID=A0A7L5DIC4_9BACT|nr:FKBP-type peptidyl-prolyl cis-trans isomerase [Spirosoma rhododendri]QJD77795.1 FKBP-type peptidylprolyl isomerase [Spirosoma rhododendri]